MDAFDKAVETRKVRLFKNGRSQAVRIPKEFEFKGQEVQITQISDTKLMVEAMPRAKISPMLEWLSKNGPIEDFPSDPGNEGLLPLDDVDV